MASLQDLAKDSSMRHWALGGKNALVKVYPIRQAHGPDRPAGITGYFTQAKFLNGMTALQIERALGLQPQSLLEGAAVLYAAKLPGFHQIDYRYSASMPDGKVWTPEMHDRFDRERRAYTGMRGDVVRDYPPGAAEVLQWQLKPGIRLPIADHRGYATVTAPFRA